jgi:GTP-binding protein EngB required for normal cell division
MPEIVEPVLHQTQQELKLCIKVIDYKPLFKKAKKEVCQWMREMRDER